MSVDGREVSILLVKNPAGANEVLRTLALEPGEHDLLAVLNDRIADGRDVSWVWDADFELLRGARPARGLQRHRAAEMALRLKYAGIDAGADRRAREPRAGARRGRRGVRRAAPLYALPTYTAMLELRELLVDAAPWRGRSHERAVIWHDLECGYYELDLPLWRELADGARGPVLDIGAGTGRVALDLARRGHEVVALDRDAELLAALRRARERPAASRPSPPTRVLRPRAPLRARARPDADDPADGRRRGAAPRAGVRRGHTPRPAAAIALAIADVREGYDVDAQRAAAARHARDRRQRSTRAARCASPTKAPRLTIERLRQIVLADGTLQRERGLVRLAHVSARRARGRGRGAGFDGRRAPIDPGVGRVRRLGGGDVRCLSAARCGSARSIRSYEHLRRPRQHAPARASLRVARDRVRADGRRDRRRDRPRRPRPLLPRRRPGPRPAPVRPGPASTSSARRCTPRPHAARSILGVCGGYQLLGHGYELGEERIPGIGLLDLATVRSDGPRLIGNVAIEVEMPGRRPAGARRLREPRRPHAPGGRRAAARAGGEGPRQQRPVGLEGARSGIVIGTYLHGPLLPKNAWFADWLVTRALGLGEPLEPLDDALEAAAHEGARRAAGVA